jgi:hypothetical protein
MEANMNRVLPPLLAATAAFCLMPASAATRLETRPWPPATGCESCVTLQFGELEMRLPAEMLGRVFVAAGGPAGIHFLPRAGTASWLLLGAKPRGRIIGTYPDLPPDLGGRQFFDMLGGADGHAAAYRAEGVARAVRYTRASSGTLHAYWIEAPPGQTQFLHIVADDGDTIYTLMGDFTERWYAAMLAHLRVVPVP